jgi:hypothetical protein
MIVLLLISASYFAATYRQHNESFTFTTYRIASNTTARWDTAAGDLPTVGLDFIGETKTNIVHGLTVGYGFYSPSHRIGNLCAALKTYRRLKYISKTGEDSRGL